MADPLAPMLSITLEMVRTKDEVLTCFLCHQGECTYEFSYRFAGARITVGAHDGCVEYLEPSGGDDAGTKP